MRNLPPRPCTNMRNLNSLPLSLAGTRHPYPVTNPIRPEGWRGTSRPGGGVSHPPNEKNWKQCFGQFFYTQSIMYIPWAQISSFKCFASNLWIWWPLKVRPPFWNIWNSKIYKGKSPAEALWRAAKNSPRHEKSSSFFLNDRDEHT